jgi:hypothetical protein
MYKVETPEGETLKVWEYLTNTQATSFRIYWDEQGVWAQACHCGSGYGKVDAKEPPVLMYPKGRYDKIEFVGKPLKMPETLKQDLRENGLL